MFKNKTLFILVLVMITNALGYGILIPLLYPYASRFGLHAAGLGFLFAAYSLFQFLATPIMGRYSDRFGRKPMLLLSLLGSSVSLAMFAAAKTVPVLFIARILDGITGGNNSIAQAIIADTTSGMDRTKAFGIIGASYGFGFMLGPALGGVLSQYGLTTPFWVAAGFALFATIFTALFLKETNPQRQQTEVSKEGMFNLHRLATALFTPVVGVLLLITLLSSMAHNAFVIAFQSYSVDILHMTAKEIGFFFTVLGVLSIIMQSGGISFLLRKWSKRTVLLAGLFITASLMFILSFGLNLYPFIFLNMFYILGFAPQAVILPAMISDRSEAEDQGGMLGINQSYTSLGQIIGPLFASAIVVMSIRSIFFGAGALFFIALLFVQRLSKSKAKADL